MTYELYTTVAGCNITTDNADVAINFIRLMSDLIAPSEWLAIVKKSLGSEGLDFAAQVIRVCKGDVA